MKIKRHKQFIKDFKKVQITDEQFEKFINYINCLRNNSPLPEGSKDHALNGEYSDCKEFHLGGESLVIYLIILKKEESR
ncbi:MAG: type II toxin-antitoxin system YafQ family toxin, partial [Candidatus Methanofishera endochildressiae]|nr:type II toxin-antitoxin system YafQ family toxin [Candidatus Methanofishera endochildressiae]